MKADIKQRWIEALRSGKYKQGRSALRYPGPEGDEFCCLGVLCELAVEDGITARGEDSGYADDMSLFGYGNGLPSRAVQEWAGLDDSSPDVIVREGDAPRIEHQHGSDLAQLNDDEGLTFEQIANVIEREL